MERRVMGSSQRSSSALAQWVGVAILLLAALAASWAQVLGPSGGGSSGAATTTSVNVVQVGGSAISLGQAPMAGSLPVAIASNQSNVPTNVAQWGGATAILGSTTSASSVPTVATDVSLLPGPGTCSSACAATTLLGPVDTTGYGSILVQVTSAGTGTTISYQGSNDATCGSAGNWVAMTGYLVSGISNVNSLVNASTTAQSVSLPVMWHCFRAQITAYASGTVTAEGYLRSGASPVALVGGALAASVLPQSGASFANSHASVTLLGTSLVAKNSAGNLAYFSCSAVAGTASGNCIAYNGTSAPSTGALTVSNVLSSCFYTTPSTIGAGCASPFRTLPINFSTGIVILCSSATSPGTYTTGTNTCWIEADYQ